MKSLLAAAFIAILFHAMLFTLNPAWLTEKKIYKKMPPAITVTMSYKKPPVPQKLPPQKTVTKVNKKQVLRPREEKKITAPVKVEEKSIETPPQVEESSIVPEDVNYTESAVDEAVYTQPLGIEEAVSEVITEAEPLYKINPEPPYPKMARKRGYQGTVLLSVLVNKEGRVDNLWLFESSGYNILDNAALEAVKEWLFEPGKQGDTAVDMWVEVPVRFEIK